MIFIHKFLVLYHKPASPQASERHGIENEWIRNGVRLLTCNNYVYYILHA